MAPLGFEVPSQSREPRRPQHTFNLITRPYQIQPFMIAPVLPGETMDFALLQSRAVSKPVNNPLIGWWKEYYFFYVKHRDLDIRDDLTEMMLDPQYDMSANTEAADVKYNHAAGGINWAKLCLKRVVEEYFRNEGEAWDIATLEGLPLCNVSKDSWLNSVLAGDYYETNDANVDANADTIIQQSEVVRAYNAWQAQVQANMTNQSYEDFLRTYGVRVPDAEEAHVPELIRYVRDWKYPTNTIDPTDGSPSSALVWSIAERADKKRYFKEPGFIFGVTCARPKVYYDKLDGSLVDFMDSAMKWIPGIMINDPQTSQHFFAENEGPLATQFADTGGYWIDLRDLFVYGDQFRNFANGTAGKNSVALPAADLSRMYPDEASINGFFVDGVTNRFIEEDGVVNLSVRSRVMDMTPGYTQPGVIA